VSPLFVASSAEEAKSEIYKKAWEYFQEYDVFDGTARCQDHESDVRDASASTSTKADTAASPRTL
jgi:hypothetical protein